MFALPRKLVSRHFTLSYGLSSLANSLIAIQCLSLLGTEETISRLQAGPIAMKSAQLIALQSQRRP